MIENLNTKLTKETFVALFVGIVLSLMILIDGELAYSQPPPLVKVKVSQENLTDGKAKYHYRVFNNSEHAVVAVRIGFDYYHGIPELKNTPVGWSFYNGLPQGSTTSPNGWNAMVITEEESPYLWVEWRTAHDDPTKDLLPGQMAEGLSVVLPQADNRYRNAHFDVILGNSTHISALLEADVVPPPAPDTTPPVLSVTLTPARLWPPNHKMVEVSASISVHDDRDPNPKVSLVSIICNEDIDLTKDILGAQFGTDDRSFSVRSERTGAQKEGRRYRVTYSATDAAGNVTTTEALVTVPHDERH
jgi:hypothetical protein